MKRFIFVLLIPFVLGCATEATLATPSDEPQRANALYSGTFYDTGVENFVSLHPYFFSHALVEAIYQRFELPDSFSIKDTAEMFGRFYYYAQNVDGAVIEIDSYPQGQSLYLNMMPYNLEYQRQFRAEDDLGQLGYLFWFNVSFEKSPYAKYTPEEFYQDNEPMEKTLKSLYKFTETNALINLRYDYNLSESNSNLYNAWICIFDGIEENDELALEYIQQEREQAENPKEENREEALYEQMYSQALYCEFHALSGRYDEAKAAHRELVKMISENEESLNPSKRAELESNSEHCEMTLLLTEFLEPYYNE